MNVHPMKRNTSVEFVHPTSHARTWIVKRDTQTCAGLCKLKKCVYSNVQHDNTRKIDYLDKEVVGLNEHVKKVAHLLDILRDRERIRDMEVTDLKESLANMARKCEELKLEPNKIGGERVHKKLQNPNTNNTDSGVQCYKF